MASPREERRLALVAKFRDVARERIAAVGQGWVRLEQGASDDELPSELSRQLHTLKGEARTVGLTEASTLAHHVEGVFHRARAAGFQQLGQGSSDVFLGGLDALGAMIAHGPPPADATERIVAALEAVLREEPAAATVVAAAPAVLSPPPSAPEQASLRVPVSRVQAFSDLSLELRTSHSQSEFLLGELASRLRRLELHVEHLAQAHAAGDAVGMGELFGTVSATLRLALKDSSELAERGHQRSLRIDELDRAAMELRLVPVGTALGHLERAARDLGAQVGKSISLRLTGADVEADKRILEAIEEPLLHLLANSVDHGIEPAADRRARGKPGHGTLVLGVSQASGSLLLTLEDDGGGIDTAVLRRMAVERRLISEEAAAALGDEEAVQLIFLQGFTTRRSPGAVSGRGVGMDVVKRRVEQLGGQLSLVNRPGKGLATHLRVPLAVSLTPALLVSAGEQVFAVPATAIRRVRRLEESEVLRVRDGAFVQEGGERLPIADLSDLLGVDPPLEEGSLALVLHSGSEACIVRVDAVIGEDHLVVRPLQRPLRTHRLVSGAAVLPSGALALMLDASEVLARRHHHRAPLPRELPADLERVRGTRQHARRALLVDDSPVFRNAVADMLGELGCAVSLAEDGQAGLEALELLKPDLVVTDIQMPRMDGLELIRRIRANPALAHLPVIAVSTLSSVQDRRRALDVGANAYLIKSELSEGGMSAAIDRLVS